MPGRFSWGEVTAIFGGTFDPPHLGHREAITGLFTYPGVKRVIVLPSAIPPHKASFASTEDRIKMVRLNFKGTGAEIDLREIERAKYDKGRFTYTFDTLQEMRQTFPQLAFVVGTDQLRDLPSWYRFPDVLGLAHWIILQRKPSTSEETERILQQWESSGLLSKTQASTPPLRSPLQTRFSTFVQIVPTEAPALSSTSIREAIARTGKAPEGSLAPEVWSYLNDLHLYGT